MLRTTSVVFRVFRVTCSAQRQADRRGVQRRFSIEGERLGGLCAEILAWTFEELCSQNSRYIMNNQEHYINSTRNPESIPVHPPGV